MIPWLIFIFVLVFLGLNSKGCVHPVPVKIYCFMMLFVFSVFIL